MQTSGTADRPRAHERGRHTKGRGNNPLRFVPPDVPDRAAALVETLDRAWRAAAAASRQCSVAARAGDREAFGAAVLRLRDALNPADQAEAKARHEIGCVFDSLTTDGPALGKLFDLVCYTRHLGLLLCAQQSAVERGLGLDALREFLVVTKRGQQFTIHQSPLLASCRIPAGFVEIPAGDPKPARSAPPRGPRQTPPPPKGAAGSPRAVRGWKVVMGGSDRSRAGLPLGVGSGPGADSPLELVESLARQRERAASPEEPALSPPREPPAAPEPSGASGAPETAPSGSKPAADEAPETAPPSGNSKPAADKAPETAPPSGSSKPAADKSPETAPPSGSREPAVDKAPDGGLRKPKLRVLPGVGSSGSSGSGGGAGGTGVGPASPLKSPDKARMNYIAAVRRSPPPQAPARRTPPAAASPPDHEDVRTPAELFGGPLRTCWADTE